MTNVRPVEFTPQFNGGAILPASAGTGKILVSNSEGKMEWQTITFDSYHTYTIKGAVGVEALLPMFIYPSSAESKIVLVRVAYKIKEGTSATLLVKKNAGTAGEFKEMKAEKAKGSTKPAGVEFAEGDELTPEITEVSGSPKGLSLQIILAHTL
jgi:hypothetical protein